MFISSTYLMGLPSSVAGAAVVVTGTSATNMMGVLSTFILGYLLMQVYFQIL